MKLKLVLLVCLFSFSMANAQTFSISDTTKNFSFNALDFTGYSFVTMTNLTDSSLNLQWKLDFGKNGIPPNWTVQLQVADSIYPNLDSAAFELDTVLFNDQIVLFCFPDSTPGVLESTITITNLDNPSEVVQVNFVTSAGFLTTTPKVEPKHSIKIFPIPAQRYFMIETEGIETLHQLEIFNQLGQRVFYTDDLEAVVYYDLNPGIYYCLFETSEGLITKSLLVK